MGRSTIRKNKNDREIKLEYRHDRLTDMKMSQAYQLLVPDKFWIKNSANQPKGENLEHAGCRDIRKSFFG